MYDENEKVEDNNKKLFVKSILQADKCIVNTIFDRPEFDEVDEIFIVSVTMDNVNDVPNYYNSIHQEIEQNKQGGLVKYYFNLNIEEYEMLMYLIENKKDVFELLRNYFDNPMLKPFSNYLKECYPEVVMPRFIGNNVYIDMKGEKAVFKRTRLTYERNNSCFFTISKEKQKKCRYNYKGKDTYVFVIFDRYIMAL